MTNVDVNQHRDVGVNRRLRDGLALNPRIPWPGIAVIAVLVAVILGLALAIWANSHHNELASAMTGTWRSFSTGAATTLDIYPGTPEAQGSTLTADLEVGGTIDGRSVTGVIVVPKWPPWGSTLQTTLLGESWSVEPLREQRQLRLTSASGATVVLEAE